MLKKILYICGSLNQTKMMHSISIQMRGYSHFFSPFYGDGIVRTLAEKKLLDFTILGGQFKENTECYLSKCNLKIDYRGENNFYDLVFICTDLIIPKNIKYKKIILIQEGMTDKENIFFKPVRLLKFFRFIAGTAATGLSNKYDYFCVASEGYRELFIKKGVKPHKIVVTGIPNFDNCASFLKNDFPYKNYVLAATSDTRETFRYENRKQFINKTLRIASGKQIIFKLHPNEKYARAKKEIEKYAPGCLVVQDGNINNMIANCDTLVTKYSSVVYLGLALGKEVYSDFDINELKKLLPIQNGGASALNISQVAENLLEQTMNIYRVPSRLKKWQSLLNNSER